MAKLFVPVGTPAQVNAGIAGLVLVVAHVASFGIALPSVKSGLVKVNVPPVVPPAEPALPPAPATPPLPATLELPPLPATLELPPLLAPPLAVAPLLPPPAECPALAPTPAVAEPPPDVVAPPCAAALPAEPALPDPGGELVELQALSSNAKVPRPETMYRMDMSGGGRLSRAARLQKASLISPRPRKVEAHLSAVNSRTGQRWRTGQRDRFRGGSGLAHI